MIHRAASVLLLVASTGALHAHDMQMAIVEVREIAEGAYTLTMRTALGAERLPGIELSLTEGCEDVGPIRRVERFDHVSFERRIACPVDGPPPALGIWNAGIVDALIRIEDRAGNLTTRIVSEPFAEIVLGDPGAGIAERFLLGVEHILSGVDHLLFVFGILLLVRGVRVVVATITAFTLAHSLTLALTVLDVVRVPGPPVEAFIALSIVYLALEVARRDRTADARLTPPVGGRVRLRPDPRLRLRRGPRANGAAAGGSADDAVPVQRGHRGGPDCVRERLGRRACGWPTGCCKTRSWYLDRAAAYGLGGIASFWVIDRVAGFW